MNDELDPELSRLFAGYAPVIESSAFLARMKETLDIEERRARWRFAIGWTFAAMLLLVLAVFTREPLGQMMSLTSRAFGFLEVNLPITPTPLNVSLLVSLIGLCLHRRIRAMLTL